MVVMFNELIVFEEVGVMVGECVGERCEGVLGGMFELNRRCVDVYGEGDVMFMV